MRYVLEISLVKADVSPHMGMIPKNPIFLREVTNLDGAGTRSRTRDLLITNQLLYQLSYASDGGHITVFLRL